ncbi:MAG TPA: LPS export ABC transporter periplasmic protein LptC [Longimicrobiales bacterium]|nr:LPS export ABC transporter periplasmic protein LptC [Longimicrobiales bacterium]
MRTFLILLSAAALIACNGTTGPATGDFDSLPADQVLYGTDHATTVGGIRRSNLKSDTTLIFNDSSAIHLIGVNLETFDVNGRVTAELTSKTGQLDRNTNRMIARGTVVLNVKGAQPQTITTEELHYDPQTKRIWSDVSSCQRRGVQTLCGSAFTAVTGDNGFTNVQIVNYSGTGIRIE